MLGSAQVRIEYRGHVAVAMGDYKLGTDPTCKSWEPVRCHLLVTESTFGLPVYRWKPEAFTTVPTGSTAATLATLLNATAARHLVILGDMFHARSSLSRDACEAVSAFCDRHAHVGRRLVRGNHDAHVGSLPLSWSIEVVEPGMQLGTVALGHPTARRRTGTEVACPRVAKLLGPSKRLLIVPLCHGCMTARAGGPMLRGGFLQDSNIKSVGMRRSLLEDWMNVALQACERGIAQGQSPFGAAIYSPDGELVGAEFNRVDADNDPTAHAEVLAIRAACQTLGVKKLDEYWLVATGEPCLMCAAVVVMSGIRNVAFGADCAFIHSMGFQTGGVASQRIFDAADIEMQVEAAILRVRCEALLRESSPIRSI